MPDFRLSPEQWIIREDGWMPDRQDYFATIMALGNGRIGSRSALEEVPGGCVPGTFIAGVFDNAGSIVDDMVNLPNPFELRLFVNGQKLSVETMKVLSHNRALDMRRGVLSRCTVFSGGLGGKFELRTERFISRVDSSALVLRATIKSLEGDAGLTVAGDIGITSDNTEPYYELKKRHYCIGELRPGPRSTFMRLRTLHSGIEVGYAWTTVVDGKAHQSGPVRVKLRRGRALEIVRLASVAEAVDVPGSGLGQTCGKGLSRMVRLGYAAMLSSHEREWEKLWNVSDISIKGAPVIEKAGRFNIYHLLICGKDGGTSSSIGAKSLTGESYRGHYFWDTEVYMLPFYVLNHPAMARHMLEYRFSRLEAAKRNAPLRGFRGALFPWESGGAGGEETPYFPDDKGGLYLWETGLFEHHIAADIPMAMMKYIEATGDSRVLPDRGLELLVETARFWASRVAWNRKDGCYDIKGVIGPDEYHYPVDNNVFTNFMARWNLETAAEKVEEMQAGKPGAFRRISGRVSLRAAEPAEWRRIAGLIKGTSPSGDGVIEQFDGYYRLRQVPITKWTRNGLPEWPGGINEKNVLHTNLNKQADIVLLMTMFPDRFTREQKVNNFRYYEKRTLHMSSLSACAFALGGLEWGVGKNAMRYFMSSLFMDLKDVARNTSKGMHAACCGGNWQMLVRGFAGVGVRNGVLSINPRVPRKWKAMNLSVVWRGNLLRLKVAGDSVQVGNSGRNAVELSVFDSPARVLPGKTGVFTAK
jgi:kojibiose phosphorylase